MDTSEEVHMRDASVGITEEEVQPAGEEVAKSGAEVPAGSPKGEDTTKSDVEGQAGYLKGDPQSSGMEGSGISAKINKDEEIEKKKGEA